MSARASFTSSSLKGLMMASIFFMGAGSRERGRHCTCRRDASQRKEVAPLEEGGFDADVDVGLHDDVVVLRGSRHCGRDAEAVGLEVRGQIDVVQLEVGAR